MVIFHSYVSLPEGTYSAHSKLAMNCIGYVVILNRCTMCSPSQAASLSLWNLLASWPKHQWSQLPQDTGTFKLWGTQPFSNIPATWNILTLYDLMIEGHTVFVAELCFPDAYVKRGSKSPVGPWIYVPTGRHIRNGKMGEPGSIWVFQSKRLYKVIYIIIIYICYTIYIYYIYVIQYRHCQYCNKDLLQQLSAKPLSGSFPL